MRPVAADDLVPTFFADSRRETDGEPPSDDSPAKDDLRDPDTDLVRDWLLPVMELELPDDF